MKGPPPTKLTEADVLKIREMRKLGIAGAFIAAEFGVSQAMICMIAKWRVWKRVPL